VVESRAAIEQAAARSTELLTKRQLAQKRLEQTRELAATGAGSRFDLEQAETTLREIEAQQESARSAEAQARASVTQAVSGEQQVRQRLGANVKGEFAQVAQIRAQLAQARWLLDQTVTRSPCNCYVINLQLRPGGFVAGLPINPVMTLVEDTGEVVALFAQNELVQVAPGDEAEFALRTHPGQIIKGRVDSVIWAQGQGTMTPSGTVPLSGVLAQPPGRFAVKFDIAERDRAIFLAAGAAGDAAVYTQRLGFLHVIRKVILRVGSYTNYLIPKLH
jgi:multidrug resistance efflux pump